MNVVRLLGALLALTVTGSPVIAQTPSGTTAETQAAALEVLQAIHADTQVVELITALRRKMMVTPGRDAAPTTDVGAVVDQLLLPDINAHAGELTQAVATIWASRMSVDDLHAMRDSYVSTAGQHLLEAQAAITAQSREAGRVWGERVAREAIAEHSDELRKRGIAP